MKAGLQFDEGSFMLSAFSSEEIDIIIAELVARAEKEKGKGDQGGLPSIASTTTIL